MSFYVSNHKPLEIKCTKNNEKFTNLQELYDLLNNYGWDEMTTFLKEQWNPDNKCCGQCNATVLLVQEYFGGEIISYPNPSSDKKGHYFNRINDVDIDLTSEQFNPQLTDYSSKKKITKNFGRYDFCCKKSAYILKLRLGLIK